MAPTPTTAPSFGTLLRIYRLAAGLTQEALAERAGLSVRGISDLERGARRSPYPETVRLLAEGLGFGPDAPERAALLAARGAAEPSEAALERPRLPTPATPLIGRERELAAIAARLARQDIR
ncbi:MAG TPA: helix-turn-helix transcriptional regulator, partial [Thermomicrobiales bacterium]|nr:helix-turn-helix transcriptional regulator [Thermomicrobiales bacterium]